MSAIGNPNPIHCVTAQLGFVEIILHFFNISPDPKWFKFVIQCVETALHRSRLFSELKNLCKWSVACGCVRVCQVSLGFVEKSDPSNVRKLFYQSYFSVRVPTHSDLLQP